MPPPHRLSFIAARGGRREQVEDGKMVVIHPRVHAPGDVVTERLELALEYEGLTWRCARRSFDGSNSPPSNAS